MFLYSIIQLKMEVEKGMSRKRGINKRTKPMDEKEKADFIEDYKNGMSWEKLNQKYNLSDNVITRLLRENNLSGTRSRKTVFDDQERVEKVIEMYRNGEKIIDISKKLKIGNKNVSKILQFYGIKIRHEWCYRENDYSNEITKKIVEAYKSGMQWSDISQTFGVSTYTILKILKKSGITLNRRAKRGVKK